MKPFFLLSLLKKKKKKCKVQGNWTKFMNTWKRLYSKYVNAFWKKDEIVGFDIFSSIFVVYCCFIDCWLNICIIVSCMHLFPFFLVRDHEWFLCMRSVAICLLLNCYQKVLFFPTCLPLLFMFHPTFVQKYFPRLLNVTNINEKLRQQDFFIFLSLMVRNFRLFFFSFLLLVLKLNIFLAYCLLAIIGRLIFKNFNFY